MKKLKAAAVQDFRRGEKRVPKVERGDGPHGQEPGAALAGDVGEALGEVGRAGKDNALDAGAAQAAIRGGIEGILFTGRADVAERLVDIAGQRGALLLTSRPVPALDLGDAFFAAPEVLHRRCLEFLHAV